MTGLPGRFGAVVSAMVTPFAADGGLDLQGAVTLARWLLEHGSDSLVLAGSTGESTSLTDVEKAELWRAVAGAVDAPVIAGAGSADTKHTVELVGAAQESGVDAVLVVTPYYSRPAQHGLDGHFRAAAAATSLPVVLYDIPSRTGRKLDVGTVLGLARDVPNIVGLKDAAGEVAGSARLIAEAPAGFEVYCGEDQLTLPLLSLGASGVVSVASHWAGEEMGEMIASFSKGDVARARWLNARLLESFDFESSPTSPNPLPTKAMMRVLGLPAGECRMPLGPAPASLEHEARNVLAQLRRSIREARSDGEARPDGEARAGGTGAGEERRPGETSGLPLQSRAEHGPLGG